MALPQYVCPPSSAPDSKKLGWLREGVQEGVRFIQSDPGYQTLNEDLRIVQRQHPEILPQEVADGVIRPPQVYAGTGKSKVADIIATLGNIQPLWNHYPAGDSRLNQIADALNKATWAWWYNTYADLRITEALQWSACQRTGYIHSRWSPHFHGLGQGDIELCTGGPHSFIPLWMGKDNNIQLAYAGTWIEDVPITEAWATWPEYRDLLLPDREPVSFWGRTWNKVKELAGVDSFMEGANGTPPPDRVPTVRVYRTWVRDTSKNLTTSPVQMGLPSASWSYTVPYASQKIPDGKINEATGQDILRTASDERGDLYLYPNRRLLEYTERCVLYDGPSRNLHGKLPVVKVTLDPWPFSYLGGSMIRDIATLEAASNREINAITERATLKHDPPKMANESQTKTTQENLRQLLRTPGAVLQDQDFKDGDPVRAILPPEHYQTSQWELESLRLKSGLMDEVLGRDYATALSEARQKPSGDTQEKTLQLKGNRIQQRGRIMEWAVTELGSHVTGEILQWYTDEKQWLLQNYKGESETPFKYDPAQVVPRPLPGFDERTGRFPSRASRAKYIHQNVRLQIEKDSLLEISSMTRQLQMQLLWNDQRFPLDPETLAEVMKIPNFGTLDDEPGTDTVMGRFKKWKMIEAYGGGMLQGLMQQGAMKTSLPPEMMQMFQAFMGLMQRMTGGGGTAPTLPSSNGGPPGRPHTYNDSPELQSKGDHTTIATS